MDLLRQMLERWKLSEESKTSRTETGETNIVVELIDLFIKDANNRLDALRKSVSESEAAPIKTECHSLKGSSGNVGASRLAAILEEMESSVGDTERMKILLEKLEIEFGELVGELDSMR